MGGDTRNLYCVYVQKKTEKMFIVRLVYILAFSSQSAADNFHLNGCFDTDSVPQNWMRASWIAGSQDMCLYCRTDHLLMLESFPYTLHSYFYLTNK